MTTHFISKFTPNFDTKSFNISMEKKLHAIECFHIKVLFMSHPFMLFIPFASLCMWMLQYLLLHIIPEPVVNLAIRHSLQSGVRLSPPTTILPDLVLHRLRSSVKTYKSTVQEVKVTRQQDKPILRESSLRAVIYLRGSLYPSEAPVTPSKKRSKAWWVLTWIRNGLGKCANLFLINLFFLVNKLFSAPTHKIWFLFWVRKK